MTEHFSDTELGVEGAEQRVLDNATFLCREVLEPIREHYGAAVHIHCGYRPPAHNAAVGGKPTSFHLFTDGRAAADFDVTGVGLAQAFTWIRGASGLPFDKVILEHDEKDIPRCIHIQADRLNAPRRQAFIGSTGAGTKYTPVEVGPERQTADV